MKFSLLCMLAMTSAVTAASLHKAQRQESLLWPYSTYRYWVNSGQWKEDPQDQLLIVKNGVLADETTTIVTFNIPTDLEGHTCKLLFDLWDRDVSTGTQEADVFTATKPTGAERSAVSLKTVAKQTAEFVVQSRDKHVGRIHITAPGTADWIQTYEGYPEFECPAGQVVGFEFVGVGDDVSVRWDIGVTGPRVQVV
ncbi:hypothetical protein BDV59DRAFT_202751 [Aspergillus ambiguus]|uniref:uncharacterized protein n=1 Tax=Aspergillus ambiguus TaxID=176160 RepID=UPI003CCCE862